MKRFILLIILAIGLTSFVSAQQPVDTTTVSFTEVYRDATVASSTIYTDTKDAIKQIGAALKVGSEHVYAVLVRQQYVKAIIGLFVLSLIIFLLYMFIQYSANVKDWDDGEVYADKNKLSIVVAIASGVLSIILTIIFFAGEYPQDIIQGFINPEYGAMMDIVDMIKQIK
jgi:uncharacterized membrane protein (DUF485 family)